MSSSKSSAATDILASVYLIAAGGDPEVIWDALYLKTDELSELLEFVKGLAKLAFVGDVLFKGSIGRTDFPRGDHATLLSSITAKLWPLGDDTRFVPGHGPMSTFGAERRSNPYVSDAALARAA